MIQINQCYKNNKVDIKMIKIHIVDVLKTHKKNNKIKKALKYKNISVFDSFFIKTFS
jgi:hypothetical protein